MRVNFYAGLRQIVGVKTVEVPAAPGARLRSLLDGVLALHPDLRPQMLDAAGELAAHIHIFVNGRDVRWLAGLDTPLDPDATINIFPPVGGG